MYSLPYRIRSSTIISSFKSSLKTYLFHQSHWLGGEREGERVREREREREGEREKERERELVVYRKVWEVLSFLYSFSLILFHVMGLLLRRRNGTEKSTLLLLLLRRRVADKTSRNKWREDREVGTLHKKKLINWIQYLVNDTRSPQDREKDLAQFFFFLIVFRL